MAKLTSKDKEAILGTKLKEIQSEFFQTYKTQRVKAIPWNEHMTVTNAKSIQISEESNVAPEYQREVQIYNITLENAKQGIGYLAQENVPSYPITLQDAHPTTHRFRRRDVQVAQAHLQDREQARQDPAQEEEARGEEAEAARQEAPEADEDQENEGGAQGEEKGQRSHRGVEEGNQGEGRQGQRPLRVPEETPEQEKEEGEPPAPQEQEDPEVQELQQEEEGQEGRKALEVRQRRQEVPEEVIVHQQYKYQINQLMDKVTQKHQISHYLDKIKQIEDHLLHLQQQEVQEDHQASKNKKQSFEELVLQRLMDLEDQHRSLKKHFYDKIVQQEPWSNSLENLRVGFEAKLLLLQDKLIIFQNDIEERVLSLAKNVKDLMKSVQKMKGSNDEVSVLFEMIKKNVDNQEHILQQVDCMRQSLNQNQNQNQHQQQNMQHSVSFQHSDDRKKGVEQDLVDQYYKLQKIKQEIDGEISKRIRDEEKKVQRQIVVDRNKKVRKSRSISRTMV